MPTVDTSSIGGAVIQQHAIEYVEELNGQFAAEPLAKEKPFADRGVFIQVRWCPERVVIGCPGSKRPASRKRKRRGINDRQPFLVVVPVNIETLPTHAIRPVSHKNIADQGVAIELVRTCEGRQGYSALVVGDQRNLPAAGQILHERTAAV